MNDTIIVPLDFPALEPALQLVDQLGEEATFFKVGLELFTAAGPKAIRALRERGKDVFLDLKYHDIPNTVAGAVGQAAPLGVRFLTVHATGGAEMMKAAVDAAEGRVTVLAVTVLTSMDAGNLEAIWDRRVPVVSQEVVRLANLARTAEVGGIVCSPQEVGAVAEIMADGTELVTPGIRFAGGAVHDQKRIATPASAISAGATRLVIGRAVTQASDPAAAFRRALAEVQSSLVGTP